jgi:hypothetical protein
MSEGSLPSQTRYLVEWYQPGLSGELLDRTVDQIGRSTAEISEQGPAVELLLTLFMPDDEVAFGLFAAGSPAAVEEACRGADLPLARITKAITGPG